MSPEPEVPEGSTEELQPLRRPRRHGPGRHPDIEVARLLVRRGYLAKQQAVEALRVQKQRAREGKERIPLLRLLVKRGALDATRLPEARDEIRRNTYICEACDARAVILAGSQSRAGSCPRCGADIAVDPASRGVSAVPVRDFTGDASESEPWLPIPLVQRQDDPSQEGRTFGRYLLREELGRGAMGVVYRARHTQLGKDVALKLLLPSAEGRQLQVARFRREAAAVQRLRHPHIIAVHDFGCEGDAWYLTMDLIERGDSLHRALKDEEQPLPLSKRLELMVKVARAVGHAHERGVVHRDLKPANVLIDSQGEPRVVDFGLAKDEEEEGELTRTQDRLGTPLFMAPEQIRRGAAAVDGRADVWALGVMLFVCATGRYPFRSRTVMDLYLRIMKEEPDWTGTRYSAPDRAGMMQARPGSPAFESTATDLVESHGDTQVASRTGPEGVPPLRLPPRPEPIPHGPLPPPFVPPPELEAKEVPADLRSIIECTLQKDPEDRYPTCEDLAEDLERFLAGKPILRARKPGWTKRLRLALRRRRVLIPLAWGLAAAVLLLGLATLALVRVQSGSRREADLQAALVSDERNQWKHFTQVEANLTRLLGEAYGSDPDFLFQRGLARLRLLRPEAAEEDLDQALAAGPSPELALRIAGEKALLQAMEGRDGGARRTARAALDEGAPQDPESLVRLAQFLLAHPEGDDLDLLERLVGPRVGAPDAPPRLQALAARVALLRGDAGLAERRLPPAREGEPFQLSLVRGALALERGDPAAARDLFGLARAAWRGGEGGQLDGDLAYFDYEGWQLKKRGSTREAALANRAAAALEPFHGRPHYWLGRLLLGHMAERALALPPLREALRRDPYDPEARDLLLAILLAHPARADEALGFLAEDAAHSPWDPEPLLLQATVHLRRGEAEPARQALEGAAAREPGQAVRVGLYQAALLRLTGGDEGQAAALEADYARPNKVFGQQAGPDSTVSWGTLSDLLELGRVYLEGASRPDLALRYVRELTARGRTLGVSYEAVERRHLASALVLEARCLARQGDEEGALAALRGAVYRNARERRDPLPPEGTPELLGEWTELKAISASPGYQGFLAELEGAKRSADR